MQVNDKKVNSIDTQNRLISVKVKDKDAIEQHLFLSLK